MGAIEIVEGAQLAERPAMKSGDTVKVHVKVREGDKERIQIFEGVVIARRGSGTSASFTARKISYGVGVERIFPLCSPRIERIEVMSKGKVRRSKLFYLREKIGKQARLDEEKYSELGPVEEEGEEAPAKNDAIPEEDVEAVKGMAAKEGAMQ